MKTIKGKHARVWYDRVEIAQVKSWKISSGPWYMRLWRWLTWPKGWWVGGRVKSLAGKAD